MDRYLLDEGKIQSIFVPAFPNYRYAACSTAQEVIATQDEWLATGGGPQEEDHSRDYPPSESESEYTTEEEEESDVAPGVGSLSKQTEELSLNPHRCANPEGNKSE